jgi:hypothetical protein
MARAHALFCNYLQVVEFNTKEVESTDENGVKKDRYVVQLDLLGH